MKNEYVSVDKFSDNDVSKTKKKKKLKVERLRNRKCFNCF